MQNISSLYPSKLYKDIRINKIVGVTYKDANLSNLNEVLFSVDKAQELNLADSDMLDYLDLSCIPVYLGFNNTVFPASSEIGFDVDKEDEGVVVTLTEQIIYGHKFNSFSGIQMDNKDAIERFVNNYEKQM